MHFNRWRRTLLSLALLQAFSYSVTAEEIRSTVTNNQGALVSGEGVAINIQNGDISGVADSSGSHGVFMQAGGAQGLTLRSSTGDISIGVTTPPSAFRAFANSPFIGLPVLVQQGTLTVESAQNISVNSSVKNAHGQAQNARLIYSNPNTNIYLKAAEENRLYLQSDGEEKYVDSGNGELVLRPDLAAYQNQVYGIHTAGAVTLEGKANTVKLNTPTAINAFALAATNRTGAISLIAREGDNELSMDSGAVHGNTVLLDGIQANSGASVELTARAGINRLTIGSASESEGVLGSYGSVYGLDARAGRIELTGRANQISLLATNVRSLKYGVFASGASAGSESVLMQALDGNNSIELDARFLSQSGGTVAALDVVSSAKVRLLSNTGDNLVHLSGAARHFGSFALGAYVSAGGQLQLDARNNMLSFDDADVATSTYGLYAGNASKIGFSALENNELIGAQVGAYAYASQITFRALGVNKIHASKTALRANAASALITLDGAVDLFAPIALSAEQQGAIDVQYRGASQSIGTWVSKGGAITAHAADDAQGAWLKLTGDVMALNAGTVDLQLAGASVMTGRVDDFSAFSSDAHQSVFAGDLTPTAAGAVHLTLAEGALWNMTAQSWVSELAGAGTINLRASSVERSAASPLGRALHIGELTGSHTFTLRLNMDGVHSDMLYIKHGTAEPQNLWVQIDGEMRLGDRLRFATVEDAKNEFVDGRLVQPSGLFLRALKVEYSPLASDPNNTDDYNKRFNGSGEIDENKPGDDYVREHYQQGDNARNVYLVLEEQTVNPSARVIPKAIDAMDALVLDLDTYTRRFAGRFYVDSSRTDGAWLRLSERHMGERGAFFLAQRDYEGGVDYERQTSPERLDRWGASFSYRWADADYELGQVSDDTGRIRGKALGLYYYSEWHDQADEVKSLYSDNILRYSWLTGHAPLANGTDGALDLQFRSKALTLSSEVGLRRALNTSQSLVLVPQAQLLLGWLSRAEGRSEDVTISSPSTLSAIARVGADLQYHYSADRTRYGYLKANVMHEFLGGREMTATDANGTFTSRWQGARTWYELGLGMTASSSEGKSLRFDVAKEFGRARGSYNARVALTWPLG